MLRQNETGASRTGEPHCWACTQEPGPRATIEAKRLGLSAQLSSQMNLNSLPTQRLAFSLLGRPLLQCLPCRTSLSFPSRQWRATACKTYIARKCS